MAEVDVARSFSRRELSLWGLVFAGLLSGAGSGVLTITQTEDRFTASEARSEFRLRDQELLHLKGQINDLKYDIRTIDENHPPKELIDDINDLEQRVRELERN